MNSKRVVVLGGGGGVGQVAALALAQVPDPDQIVVADLSLRAAQATVEASGDDRLKAQQVDVSSADSLAEVLKDADVVLNCVGPFYKFGPPALAAAIAAGADFVDVCDDLDATRMLLELNADAATAGVQALIGMGNSPGLANIFVKMCDEWFLDEVHSAKIMHVHGGEPDEGPGVLKHRIHAMTSDVPVFTDGVQRTVRMLEPSGEALVHEEEFAQVGKIPVYPYPHPETITLPTVFPRLTAASNYGVVFPLEYFTMTQDLVRAGMADEDPVATADGTEVVPIDVMVALLRKARPQLLADANVSGPSGCLKVVVSGVKDGAEHTYVASVFSDSAGAGAGTGIPAAIGVVLALRGELAGGPGVFPPEAIVPVSPVLDLAGEILNGMPVGEADGLPMQLEHLGPDGVWETVPFSLGDVPSSAE